MPGAITFQPATNDGVARVVLANPGKLNAIDIAMWRELRALFDTLQALSLADAPRAIVVSGADGHFASGGDIVEFASFRFDEERLHDFHEHIVAPALHAMLNCDIPLFAQIDGACIGGGLEIAACCDIRICGAAVLREMLLEARLLDAARALQLGLVHAVVADAEVATQARERARDAARLSPQAARINKRTLRQIAAGGPGADERRAHFAYADSTEHREGVTAFIEKRPPRFTA